ncbi:hypothetical protein F5Y12DRAFT_155227 [Xylaria sp. FL1777]|nr:hypothetical protein F5Y12DRAFT_155227 [Xylaria sp. FL1777]
MIPYLKTLYLRSIPKAFNHPPTYHKPNTTIPRPHPPSIQDVINTRFRRDSLVDSGADRMGLRKGRQQRLRGVEGNESGPGKPRGPEGRQRRQRRRRQGRRQEQGRGDPAREAGPLVPGRQPGKAPLRRREAPRQFPLPVPRGLQVLGARPPWPGRWEFQDRLREDRVQGRCVAAELGLGDAWRFGLCLLLATEEFKIAPFLSISSFVFTSFKSLTWFSFPSSLSIILQPGNSLCACLEIRPREWVT